MDEESSLEIEIASLRRVLAEKEAQLLDLRRGRTIYEERTVDGKSPERFIVLEPVAPASSTPTCIVGSLPRWAIERYSRQILLPNIGVSGQEKLSASSVLVVGAGGLGCPALAYLAGAGIGTVGIVDYDTVDLTNLHRQILHGEAQYGVNKVDSAAQAVKRLNSHVRVNTFNVQLNSANALQIISDYDIVLDCTDNVATRYLLNDACVISKVPLVSGSALKMEGQLTIYGYNPEKEHDKEAPGPCYRCLFPKPPPPETVGSCSAQGVLGAVPGVIGVLQALEAIKLVVGGHRPLAGRMLLFDGEECSFRSVKLRGKNPECAACGDAHSESLYIDYEQFCQSRATEKDLDLKILQPEQRISPKELYEKITAHNLKNDQLSNCQRDTANCSRDGAVRHLLVDVRSEQEFRMCRIDGSVNYPIDSLTKKEKFEDLLNKLRHCEEVTFVCRRGNDSQLAARRVLEALRALPAARAPGAPAVRDLRGGLHAWSRHVDANFPVY